MERINSFSSTRSRENRREKPSPHISSLRFLPFLFFSFLFHENLTKILDPRSSLERSSNLRDSFLVKKMNLVNRFSSSQIRLRTRIKREKKKTRSRRNCVTRPTYKSTWNGEISDSNGRAWTRVKIKKKKKKKKKREKRKWGEKRACLSTIDKIEFNSTRGRRSGCGSDDGGREDCATGYRRRWSW